MSNWQTTILLGRRITLFKAWTAASSRLTDWFVWAFSFPVAFGSGIVSFEKSKMSAIRIALNRPRATLLCGRRPAWKTAPVFVAAAAAATTNRISSSFSAVTVGMGKGEAGRHSINSKITSVPVSSLYPYRLPETFSWWVLLPLCWELPRPPPLVGDRDTLLLFVERSANARPPERQQENKERERDEQRGGTNPSQAMQPTNPEAHCLLLGSSPSCPRALPKMPPVSSC